MAFIIILILTTLSIAGTAAFFSIYGLAAIFSGIFWPVVLMGTSLEAGKLVAASYVYRYRDIISTGMKIYLVLAILILMLITSAGIFGFLSMGYQQDTLPLKQQEQQIELLQSERIELETFKKERLERRKQIDNDIASLPNNYITGRKRLLEAFGPELKQLRADIDLYTKQIGVKITKISELKQQKLISEVHTGPIIFIAKAFSADTDDATKWMIILIMFAFDPLAVILTIGVNIAINQRKKELGLDTPVIKRAKNPPVVTTSPIEKSPDVEKTQDIELEPEPKITSVEELEKVSPAPEQKHDMTPIVDSIEQLQSMLREMNNRPELTQEEQVEKEQIEQLLRRKKVTERLRSRPHTPPETPQPKVVGKGKPFFKKHK